VENIKNTVWKADNGQHSDRIGRHQGGWPAVHGPVAWSKQDTPQLPVSRSRLLLLQRPSRPRFSSQSRLEVGRLTRRLTILIRQRHRGHSGSRTAQALASRNVLSLTTFHGLSQQSGTANRHQQPRRACSAGDLTPRRVSYKLRSRLQSMKGRKCRLAAGLFQSLCMSPPTSHRMTTGRSAQARLRTAIPDGVGRSIHVIHHFTIDSGFKVHTCCGGPKEATFQRWPPQV
jgi:hypothetical protein